MKNLLILISIFSSIFPSISQTAGNSLHFDGTNDYVDCPLPSLFNSISSNDFTIELWASPTVGSFQRLVFAQLDVDNFAAISLNSSGEVVFYLSQNGINQSVQSLDVVNSLELTHIAVTWNSSLQETKIFVNGDETAYASGLFVSSTATDGKMAIGAKTDGSQVFTGYIDELAIWSIAKSECEISFEMNDKKMGAESNLVSYFTFDHGTAGGSNPGVVDLQDATASSNDGTLINFDLSGTTSNWITSIVNINRWWGAISQVFIGQLGLISFINADQYQWIYCEDLTPVPGATNVTFDPPTEDPNYTGVNDFYAVISTKGTCVDTSGCFNVNGEGLSIDEVDLESTISIYPNPTNGLILIESSLEMESIEIRKITGELVETLYPNGLENLNVDLSIKSGIYLLLIHTEYGNLIKKILVQNM